MSFRVVVKMKGARNLDDLARMLKTQLPGTQAKRNLGDIIFPAIRRSREIHKTDFFIILRDPTDGTRVHRFFMDRREPFRLMQKKISVFVYWKKFLCFCV